VREGKYAKKKKNKKERERERERENKVGGKKAKEKVIMVVILQQFVLAPKIGKLYILL
jgi:hypothetical protein